MDTIKTVARDRHFHTVELRLANYGQVLVIGDRRAVQRLLTALEKGESIVFEASDDETEPGGAVKAVDEHPGEPLMPAFAPLASLSAG